MKACVSGLERLDDFVEILQVIAEPHRLKMLCLLSDAQERSKECSCEGECKCQKITGLCVYEIVDKLQKPQALISHHLGMLKRINMVTTQRVGQKIYYSLNPETF